jgi:hypothetical protein
MISGVVSGKGSSYEMGYIHGSGAAAGVRHNVDGFFGHLQEGGYNRETVVGLAREQSQSDARWQDQLAGIADGAGLQFGDVLAYNVYHDVVSPEECTVSMAIGKASATGETVFAKNSDKVGGASLVGPNFYRNKEVNVILFDEMSNGVKIVGVCAAGTTGLKMGMNNRGIVGGCNIARTEEMYAKKLDLTQIRAVDRAWLLRIGLELDNVLAATNLVAGKILEAPMATPGNLEFADAHEGYVIEGSYDRIAIKHVVDDVDSRSNMFITLSYLNKKDDVSSMCRYWRTQEVLKAKMGKVTMQDMVAISMDHANGPGPNSVCRHGVDFTEEISLSAMVMEMNGKEPEKSKFGIALGKPCHAWRDPQGHVFGDMTWKREQIPAGFYNGDTFKKFYIEEPRLS